MTEKKNFLLRETPLTRWRIDSERISSPPPLSLVVFHWRRSTLLWPLSKFVLALHPARPHALSHTQTHIHCSCLALSFPFRHLTIVATTTASRSLCGHTCFPSSRISRSLHPPLSSLPSCLTCGLAKSLHVCHIVRSDSHTVDLVD